jgi:5-formyltetrahydrofolate cyclo-ligase
MGDLNYLRKIMREKRNALTTEFREEASKKLLLNFKKLNNFNNYNNIGVYYAFDGEIDLKYIIQYCWSHHKKCFLPVLKNKALMFCEYGPTTSLVKNKFGISEPEGGDCVEVSALDVVLLPLTAFDSHGHRLGMGQGYYDLTLFGLKNPPKRVGIGYNLQCIEGLVPRSRDVTLDAIITEKDILHVFN